MAGPATPGQEGPSFAPPPLPQGWIAQWDGVGRKYYFVQLSTGASQWELPTHPAPTVGTPTTTPGQEASPFAPPGQHQEIDQRDFERGHSSPDEGALTSMAMRQLMNPNGGRAWVQQSRPRVNLTGSLLSSMSLGQSGHSSDTGSLLGQHQQPMQHSSYLGQQTHGGYHQHQRLAGKGGDMFGGSVIGQPSNQYGYSPSGTQPNRYTGQAPPTSYQPAAPPPHERMQHLLHGPGGSSGGGSFYNSQPPPYSSGAPQQQPKYSSGTQPPYGTPQHYPQQTEYGTPHQQPAYGLPLQHQQQQYPNYNAVSPYQEQSLHHSDACNGMPTRNAVQPQHYHCPEPHSSMYGNEERWAQPPIRGHPDHSVIQGQYNGSKLGGSYSNIQGGGRWQTNEDGRQWN